MFDIKVPASVVGQSYLCNRRVNLGNRGDGSDGTIDQQLTGIIGQNTILHELKMPMMSPSGRHDGGVDFDLFGLDFDIKTMGRKGAVLPHYTNNFVASQLRLNATAYLFCSLNVAVDPYVLTVCGWLPKVRFLSKAALHQKGAVRTRDNGETFSMKADTYEIDNECLFGESKSIFELCGEIYWWTKFQSKARAA